MPSTAFAFPGTVVSVDDAGPAWTGLTNLAADDNVYAQTAESPGASSDKLRCTNFGFSIPDGSTAITVEPEFARFRDAGSVPLDGWTFRLVHAGAGIGISQVVASDWPTSEAVYAPGAGAFGAALTSAIINASTFGVQVHVSWSAGAPTPEVNAYMDYVRMKVHYTDPAGVRRTQVGIGIFIGI